MKLVAVKLFNGAVWIFTVCVGIPLLWAIEPFWRVRINNLPEDRIGHLSLDMEIYARDIQSKGMPPRTTHIFLTYNTANRQLLEMWKRHLFVVENYLLRKASMVFLPILKKTRFGINYRRIRDASDTLSAGKATLHFSDEEHVRGKKALLDMGIGPRDWFVCFHARSPQYLFDHSTSVQNTQGLSIRDCSTENFIPAMKWIVEKGGFALRIGSHPDKPLPDLGPRVIDYATNYRTDFMDVYLTGNCRFMVGSDTGISYLPIIFNVPTCAANYASWWQPGGLGTGVMLIPKLLRDREERRFIPFPEFNQLDIFGGESSPKWENLPPSFYEEHNLEWVENSSEEILDFCRDMMDQAENRPPPQADEVARLQAAFKEAFRTEHASFKAETASSIGPRFALKYKDLIIGNA